MLGRLVPCGGGDPIPLLDRKLLIGRRSSCDIRLDFQNVSNHHCELELRDGYWHIRDLNSSNGIKVNGERCDLKVLTPGDEVCIGKHHLFIIDYNLAADAPAPQEEGTFSRSLMEKAGLEVDRQSRQAMPDAAGKTPPRKARQTRRASSEDDFIMDWLSEE